MPKLEPAHASWGSIATVEGGIPWACINGRFQVSGKGSNEVAWRERPRPFDSNNFVGALCEVCGVSPLSSITFHLLVWLWSLFFFALIWLAVPSLPLRRLTLSKHQGSNRSGLWGSRFEIMKAIKKALRKHHYPPTWVPVILKGTVPLATEKQSQVQWVTLFRALTRL